MTDQREASAVARAAGILRAEAANGLFWGSGEAETARLHQIRRHAAALLSEVDPRPRKGIEAVFDRDRNLRTPIPGTELRVRCADGRTVVHRRRLRGGFETLSLRLANVAMALRTDMAGEVAGIADTDLAGLPCPHTYLLVYETDTPLDSTEAAAELASLAPTDPDLDGEIPSLPPVDSAVEVIARDPLPVTPAAAAILAKVAALSEESLEAAENVYARERHERILALCRDTAEIDGPYERVHCGDISADCVSTGADAAIFDDRDRILLIRRTDTGQWAMPGGAAEVGEPVGLASVREAAEETGLNVALTGLVCAFDKREVGYADSRVPMIMCFAARMIAPEQPIRLEELEATEYRWAGEDELDSIDFFRGHQYRVPAAFAARAGETDR
ncbi:NUDIX hydrolase [Glycomyces salinus]|uniref:NUDIX hydrolase n=1 Tax=Glycomyces salinus TaxID=980294 RepID=UPI0018EBAF25|nr:NUDIX domain-containing protein [Glycomyces salinus]